MPKNNSQGSNTIVAKPSSKAADGRTDNSLAQDVEKFASQLGFASGSGFNDADFQPELASKRIGSQGRTEGRRSSRGDQVEQDLEVAQRRRSGSQAGPSNREPQHSKQKLAAVKGRGWKSGVGTRPGEKYGKTLLGKEESTIWHQALEDLQVVDSSKPAGAVDEWELERLRGEAESAVEREARNFEQELGRNRADFRWLTQIRQAGTTADKLGAMSLLLQESAVANLKSLDETLKWVTKRSGARGVAGEAIDALRELFRTILLPERKLLFFEQQPLAALPNNKAGQRLLLYYYIEDAIKKRYIQFVKALQEASRDNLDFLKEKATKAMYTLLRSKPEQEAVLLTALVDKLGDPARRIASNAGYLLSQLLEEHPSMSIVVAKEVERFVFRPHLPARAVYYAVVFLNQIVLSDRPELGGNELAKRLIDVYFKLFQLILEGKIGHASEMRAARDAAAAKSKGKPKDKTQKKGRWGDKRRNKKVCEAKDKPQAHLLAEGAEVDAKLLGALLAGVRRAFPFVKATDTEALMERHSSALFRVMHTATFGVAVQSLALLFQLLDARSAISDRFYRALYGILLSPDLARSSKAAMLLSLLFKAMKADVSEKRIIAFMKRLLQVAVEQLPNFASGCLLLVSEVFKERPSLWRSISESEELEDDLEHFEDQLDDEDGLTTNEPPTAFKGDHATSHRGSDEDGEEPESQAGSQKDSRLMKATKCCSYDMFKRDPLYCRAELSCLWELLPLAAHVHPSVALMAQTLLRGVPIDFVGDPMRSLSLSTFLEKFVQKKPKANIKGKSLMQPLDKTAAAEVVTPAFAEFAQLPAAEVAADVAYFHKFFEVKAEREAAGVRPKGRRRKVQEEALVSDDDSLADSDADEEEIEDFMEDEEAVDDLAADTYDDLASAMAADGEVMEGGEDTNSEAGDEVSGETEGDNVSESDIDSMALLSEDAISGSEEEADNAGEDDIPDDVNVFKLGGPSDDEGSEEEDGWSAEGSGSDEGEMADGGDATAADKGQGWLLAPGAEEFLGEPRKLQKSKGNAGNLKTMRAVLSKPANRTAGKRKRAEGLAVFASASDYDDLIEESSRDPQKSSSKAGKPFDMKRKKR